MIWPWRRRRREAELDEEIAGHLAMAARDHEARGESAEEATFAARREFGNATVVKETTRAMWGGAWLDQAAQDLRLAVRSLRRSPGFLLVAVLALGLGLGLSTMMFAVIEAAIHPEQAYANVDRLMLVSPRMSTRSGKLATRSELFQLIRERVPALDAVVPFTMWREPIEVGGQEREVIEYQVPPQFFDVVGLTPVVGRPFVEADGEAVAVVSYEIWRRGLSGRRDLSGVHIAIGKRSFSVVGVLPRSARDIAAVVPLPPGEAGIRYAMPMPLVRLRVGATRVEAASQLQALASVLTAIYSTRGNPWGLNLLAWLDAQSRAEMDGIHLAMVGAALAVLLIACINLAHLMLARGLAKRRELAVRMAIGAGRAAVARVMLAESGLIAVVGVAIGGVLAAWGARVLESIMPYEVGVLGRIQSQLDWRVFALAALAAVASGLLFGLFPAMRVALSVGLTEPLKDDAGTTTGSGRRYEPLVVLEVALALVLLMSGTLLLRAVHRLRTAPTGFDAATLVQAEAGGSYSWRPTPQGRDTTISVDWQQLLAIVRAVPGVRGAALQGVSQAPGAAITAEMGGDSTRLISMHTYPVVSSDYLDVHGLPILRGRDFEPGDAAGNGVAILSAAAAARLYPHGDAIGRMIKLGGPATSAPWVRVVGVARTPLTQWGAEGIGSDVSGSDYLPVWVVQPPGKWFHAFILVRTDGNPGTLTRVRRALRDAPGVFAARALPFTFVRDTSISFFTFLSKVFVALGAIGLGLAAFGVYGVLAYAVARRSREFGVRIALGAEPHTLYRMVMHDGLVMLLAGTGIGAFGALAAAPLLGRFAGSVEPSDAISLVLAEGVLLAAGLAAAVAPARRALRANPLDVIRAV